MILHANAIPQNRSARIRAGGIDRDDPDRTILFAIVLGQLIDQRALARPRRSGQAENSRVARLRKQGFQQLRPPRRSILHSGDGAGQSPRIAAAQALKPGLKFRGQTVSVKQSEDREETDP